jgi:phosphoserine phosphatase
LAKRYAARRGLVQDSPPPPHEQDFRIMAQDYFVVSYGPELPDRYLVAVQSAVQECGATIVELENAGDRRCEVSKLAVEFDGGIDVLRHALRPLDAGTVTGGAPAGSAGTAVVPAGLVAAARKLLIMDVDSTLIKQEVIELLAAHAGKEAEVTAVTEAAMRGELDFTQSLHARVATLKDLPESVIDEVRAKVELSDGADVLVAAFLQAGHPVAVVSGGFSQILDPLAARLQLTYARANLLGVDGGYLTGTVIGEVVDRKAKEAALRAWAAEQDIPLEHTIAVGDGANDLDMLGAAGLGVAFNAKPAVRSAADAAVDVPYLDIVRHFAGV